VPVLVGEGRREWLFYEMEVAGTTSSLLFSVSCFGNSIIRRGQGKGTGEVREKTREKKILVLIAAKLSISMNELAEQIGITSRGIEWQIRQLN